MNRTIKTFLTPLIFISLVSCQNDNNKSDDDGEFQTSDYSITYKQSGFKKVPNGSTYGIEYDASGTIKNNTSDILKGAFIEMRIVIKLGNGNEVNNQQIDPAPFMFDPYHELLKGQFLPNSLKDFELKSLRMDKEYISYPVRKFFIQYVIKGDNILKGGDPIVELVEQKDVTREWELFIKTFDAAEHKEDSNTNE